MGFLELLDGLLTAAMIAEAWRFWVGVVVGIAVAAGAWFLLPGDGLRMGVVVVSVLTGLGVGWAWNHRHEEADI